jgi:hypothetical protein
MSTRFHCDLVSEVWLQSLAVHLGTAIAAHDEYETAEGDGVVYSEYNEERYMGPLSVVKYFFRVEINVGRSSSTEDQARYEADVEYCPDTSTFKTRYENIDTKETRKRKREEAAQRRAAMESAADKVREHFEGREAIYVEKGALHVRIINIQADVFPDIEMDCVALEVEEIPTVGFENTLIHERLRSFNWHACSPLRWKTGASSLEHFWEYEFDAGYGGFVIYFAPQVVQGIVELAAQWPDELPEYERYNEVVRYLSDHTRDRGRQLFPD